MESDELEQALREQCTNITTACVNWTLSLLQEHMCHCGVKEIIALNQELSEKAGAVSVYLHCALPIGVWQGCVCNKRRSLQRSLLALLLVFHAKCFDFAPPMLHRQIMTMKQQSWILPRMQECLIKILHCSCTCSFLAKARLVPAKSLEDVLHSLENCQ